MYRVLLTYKQLLIHLYTFCGAPEGPQIKKFKSWCKFWEEEKSNSGYYYFIQHSTFVPIHVFLLDSPNPSSLLPVH